jgi:transcriptional regulator with XRE-family HTH domain
VAQVNPPRLRAIRHSTGLGPDAAAHRIGITTAALLQYERGDRRPSITTLGRLADLYRCGVEEFFAAEPENVA